MSVTPDRADLRIAVPVAVAWVVAAVLVGSASAAWVVAAVAGAVLLGGTALLWVRAPGERMRVLVALVVTAAALVCVVAVAVGVGDARRTPAVIEALAGRSASVTVVLDRDLTAADRSVLATLRTAGPATGLEVPVRVVPAEDEDAPRPGTLGAGTTLRARATLEPDDAGAATAFVVFLRGMSATVPPTGFLALTDHARQAFADVTADLPQPGGALLRGLAIGDRSGLDPATEAAMEASALTHLTAVSGSNCAVVVALVVLVGRAAGLGRGARAASAVVLLVGFVVLVRPDPSILRASVMAVVVLVVHLAGRPVRGVPLIALAAIGMLVVDPWFARSFAFGLSVLATSGIVVLGPPLTALLARRCWTPVAAAVAVPVAAQVACWPLTIPLAPALPTYAVPANLLAEPFAPVVTVTGLLACVLAPLWPAAAGVVAAVAWAPAAVIGVVAHVAAGLPVASLPWPVGVVGVVTAAVVSGSIAVAVLVPAGARMLLVLLAAVVVVIGLATTVVPAVLTRAGLPRDWSVAMCDVGQGDATLLRDGASTALVDVGDDPDRLRRCLDLLGVDRIDLLVLTHYDEDHVGALDEVTDDADLALVGPPGRPADAGVLRRLTAAGVDVRGADDGVHGVLGRVPWRVLWPRAGESTRGNEASIVLRTDRPADCVTCLTGVFLGDLDATAQRRLRGSVPSSTAVGPVDLVKVAHHGSADQDPTLYRELAAPVGLIGVGAENTYGHPTERALEMLAAAGTTPFRTDRQGTIVVQGAADGPEVWAERQAPAAAPTPRTPARTTGVVPPGRPSASGAARRLDPAPSEGPHARQEARARRREDRPGPVVGHPARTRRPRDRPRDLPRRAGHRHAPRPARRRGARARGP